jgi:hypothetical protein
MLSSPAMAQRLLVHVAESLCSAQRFSYIVLAAVVAGLVVLQDLSGVVHAQKFVL